MVVISDSVAPEVKMAGYCPSFFFCVFMDGDEVEVNKQAKKKDANVQIS